MKSRLPNPASLLLVFGLLVLALSALSIADMFVPRPYDGVVPRADVTARVVVQEVIRGSGAARAGIRPGDVILGIDHDVLLGVRHAARLLNEARIGDRVLYLVRRPSGLEEISVRLDRRRIGDGTFLYASLLGFSFLGVGFFVLIRQPTLRASQVFFLLCGQFMLFLICRLRPASYSGVDAFLLNVGTLAFLMLPPTFLHFYLLFPRPAWLRGAERDGSWGWLARIWKRFWPVSYVLPVVVFFGGFLWARALGRELALFNGAPLANWWLLALFVILGLLALRANSLRLKNLRERRGLVWVLVGSFFGLLPFLVSTLMFAPYRQSEAFFVFGIMPIVLVPFTFAYGIVRFQLLDIQVILRRSLLYTVTTALVTGLYAGGIATFNALFRGSDLAASGYFPIFLALAIVLLFDPTRRRIQELIDRFFFAGRSRLERAMVELGEAVTIQVDLQAVVEELVERLPKILQLRFAALYLLRGYRLERVAGPGNLPPTLPVLPEVQKLLRRRARMLRIDQLGTLLLRSPKVAEVMETLADAGVEVIGDLASRRRHLGMVVLSGREGQIGLEHDELELLQQLLQQASLALETSLLLDERTQKAELEREMEIAATIQAQLLPEELRFAEGWGIAAACRPARIVGGDFYAQLPPSAAGHEAVIFGDVAGKSVSGALMMMAAHEALHALAMTEPDPAALFSLANRRLYALGKRNFVALGYFGLSDDGCRLRYLIAGQPVPVLRRASGEVEEIPLSPYRIPIGALAQSGYRSLEIDLDPGDVVVGYSDGVVEARSPGGEVFGEERLFDVIAAAPPDPETMVQRILLEIEAFSRQGLQYDDMTLVVVVRHPEGQPC